MYHRLDGSLAPPGEPEHSRKGRPRYLMPHGSFRTCFQQPCPTCGRRLQILVEHLGRRVFCSHCRGAFVARDLSEEDYRDEADEGSSVLRRAEELLELLQ